jgi:rhamnose transport system permease protein
MGKTPGERRKFNLNFKELGTIVMIILVYLVSAIVKPDVFGGDTLPELIKNVLLWMPLIIVVSMGMMMVIISKNIDLSVGSIVGFCAMAVGLLFRDAGLPMWLGVIVAILMGAILGAFNGFLVSILDIPAIIVTLGTMNAFRGLAFIICGGKQIDGHEMPLELKSLVQNGITVGNLTIPWLVWIAIAILFVFAFIMKYTRFGREIYAVGSNSQAAFLRGISVKKTVFLVYVITGACSGLAAIMYACRYGYVNPSNTGNGFEFVVISATIIGGTSINGGSGTVIGTFLGSVLLGSINTMLATVGVAGTFQQASYGFIIIMALIIDTIVQKGQGRRIANRLSGRIRRAVS